MSLYLDILKKIQLLEGVPEPIVVCTTGGQIVAFNEKLLSDLRLLGKREEVLKGNVFDYLAERDLRRARADFEAAIRSGPIGGKVFSLKRGDGTEIAVETSVKLIKDKYATFVIIILRDVSERLKAEEAVREARDKLEATVQAIPDIMFEVDMEGRIYDYHSPTHGALYAPPDVFLGKKVGEILPAEATETIIKAIAQADRAGWHVGSSYVLDMSTGRRWFELSIQKKGRDKTNHDRFIVLVRDITKRKKAEEALRESEVKFRAAFDQTGAGMGMATLDGTLIEVNDAYCRMLGYERGEIIGKKTVAFTHPDDIATTMRTFEMLASLEKDTLQYEKRYIRKDGRQIFAFINVSTIHDADGKPAYVLAQIHDVTERKRLEDELRMHTEHLEELVKEKTKQLQDAQRLATIGETATMVGHDLRNPLQAIVNLIFIMDEMLDKAPPFPEKEDMQGIHRRIEQNANYMNKIVSDLTDFARPLVPNLTDVSVVEVVKDAMANIKIPVNIKTGLRIHEDLRAKIDPLMMIRVLTNLITNAVQAMPEGGCIEVGAFKRDGKLTLKVTDTGIGISEKVAEMLFIPLRAHKSKGMGMGLPVVKRMVEAHNGTITYSTAEGKGTTFIIGIPQESAV